MTKLNSQWTDEKKKINFYKTFLKVAISSQHGNYSFLIWVICRFEYIRLPLVDTKKRNLKKQNF